MILPDYLSHGLRVVICGTAVGAVSANKGHYYAGPGNEFWNYLYDSRLTSRLLAPSEDDQVTTFGIGITDLAKLVSASNDRGLRKQYDIAGFTLKMEHYKPRWIAFHGKESATAVSGMSRVRLGRQGWTVANRPVFVLPSASGSNRDPRRLEGKISRLEWFHELRRVIGENLLDL